jgi:RHH-type rel operon transcriptional repressor/antitoxin RelB
MHNIVFDENTEKRLADAALRGGRSPDQLIAQAVEDLLDDWEDYDLAEERMERIRSGRERAYTLDEVERRLDLGD